MNLELVRALDEAMQGRRVHFEWVKGHTGHVLNEAADRLANAAAAACRDGRDPDVGPGWPGAAVTSGDVQAGPTPSPEPEPDLFSGLEDDDRAPTAAEEVIALERSLLTDAVRGDRASVAALLHPQWQEVGRSGRLWTRDELLAEIGPIPLVTLDVVDVQEVAPDALLLLWRALAEDGHSSLRSSLWVRAGGGWQQRFHQGTDET
jgi:ribonuclease HI